MENQPSTALSPVDEFAELLPDALRKAYYTIPPELQGLTEKELKRICYPLISKKTGSMKKEYEETTIELDTKLRHAFWLEFELSIQQNRTMIPTNIYGRMLTGYYFYETVLKDPKRVAWITYPPGNYTVDVETLLTKSTDRLYEMVNVPFTSKVCRCHYICKCRPKGIKPDEWDRSRCACKQSDGCICPEKVDTKAMELILKMRDSLELRAKGSIPQVVRQTTMSMQLHGKAPDQKSATQIQSVEDMEKELEVLRAKKQELLGPSPTTEVTHTVIDTAHEVVD